MSFYTNYIYTKEGENYDICVSTVLQVMSSCRPKMHQHENPTFTIALLLHQVRSCKTSESQPHN